MKKMKWIVVVAMAALLTEAKTVNAQQYFAQDVNGQPLRTKRYLDVNGSAYLTDSWQKATVELNDGKTYNLDIKYDMVADNLLFKNKNGDSLAFTQPVKQFKIELLNDSRIGAHLFRSGFPSAGGKSSETTFYEVLYDGGTKLLKKRSKTVWEETNTYGSANINKNIIEKVLYFVDKNNQMIPLKNDRKSVLAVLSDKQADVDKYIKDNKLDVKQDADLAKVFEYYNSLH